MHGRIALRFRGVDFSFDIFSIAQLALRLSSCRLYRVRPFWPQSQTSRTARATLKHPRSQCQRSELRVARPRALVKGEPYRSNNSPFYLGLSRTPQVIGGARGVPRICWLLLARPFDLVWSTGGRGSGMTTLRCSLSHRLLAKPLARLFACICVPARYLPACTWHVRADSLRAPLSRRLFLRTSRAVRIFRMLAPRVHRDSVDGVTATLASLQIAPRPAWEDFESRPGSRSFRSVKAALGPCRRSGGLQCCSTGKRQCYHVGGSRRNVVAN